MSSSPMIKVVDGVDPSHNLQLPTLLHQRSKFCFVPVLLRRVSVSYSAN